jgi:hypothetical protein
MTEIDGQSLFLHRKKEKILICCDEQLTECVGVAVVRDGDVTAVQHPAGAAVQHGAGGEVHHRLRGGMHHSPRQGVCHM